MAPTLKLLQSSLSACQIKVEGTQSEIFTLAVNKCLKVIDSSDQAQENGAKWNQQDLVYEIPVNKAAQAIKEVTTNWAGGKNVSCSWKVQDVPSSSLATIIGAVKQSEPSSNQRLTIMPQRLWKRLLFFSRNWTDSVNRAVNFFESKSHKKKFQVLVLTHQLTKLTWIHQGLFGRTIHHQLDRLKVHEQAETRKEKSLGTNGSIVWTVVSYQSVDLGKLSRAISSFDGLVCDEIFLALDSRVQYYTNQRTSQLLRIILLSQYPYSKDLIFTSSILPLEDTPLVVEAISILKAKQAQRTPKGHNIDWMLRRYRKGNYCTKQLLFILCSSCLVEQLTFISSDRVNGYLIELSGESYQLFTKLQIKHKSVQHRETLTKYVDQISSYKVSYKSSLSAVQLAYAREASQLLLKEKIQLTVKFINYLSLQLKVRLIVAVHSAAIQKLLVKQMDLNGLQYHKYRPEEPFKFKSDCHPICLIGNSVLGSLDQALNQFPAGIRGVDHIIHIDSIWQPFISSGLRRLVSQKRVINHVLLSKGSLEERLFNKFKPLTEQLTASQQLDRNLEQIVASLIINVNEQFGESQIFDGLYDIDEQFDQIETQQLFEKSIREKVIESESRQIFPPNQVVASDDCKAGFKLVPTQCSVEDSLNTTRTIKNKGPIGLDSSSLDSQTKKGPLIDKTISSIDESWSSSRDQNSETKFTRLSPCFIKKDIKIAKILRKTSK